MRLNQSDVSVVKNMVTKYLENHINKCQLAINLSYNDKVAKNIAAVKNETERSVLLTYAKLFTHTQTEPELIDNFLDEDYKNLSMVFDYSQEQNRKLAHEIFGLTQDNKLYLKVKSEGEFQREVYTRIFSFLKKVETYRFQGMM